MSTSPVTSSSTATSTAASSTVADSSVSDSTTLVQPQTIVGVSQYSSDLQSILTRAVQIADIPVQQLQSQQQDAMAKKAALIALNNDITTFNQSLTALGTVASGGAITATSSDPSITVENTGATTASSWTVSDIQSIAAAASENSQNPYANSTSTPVSVSGANHLTLVVGSQDFEIDTSASGSNNLNAVVQAINGSGLPVTASVLTAASGEDYLSVAANNTGATKLQLLDGAKGAANRSNLLTDTNQGTDAKFDLNNIPIDQSSNVVNDVIPGVTFTLVSQPASDTSVTLSLSVDPTQISNALSTFVQSYNTLVDDIGQQVGQSAGALQGDSALTTLESDMRQLVSYQGTNTGANAINSLAGLGVTLDSSGKMTFNQNTATAEQDVEFDNLSSAQIQSAISFLGSSTTGLASMSSSFTLLDDPVSGLIQNEENGFDQTNTNLANQISAMNQRIEVMETSLQTKLEQADSLLAQLQSQQSVLSASITSLNYVLYGQQNVSV